MTFLRDKGSAINNCTNYTCLTSFQASKQFCSVLNKYSPLNTIQVF